MTTMCPGGCGRRTLFGDLCVSCHIEALEGENSLLREEHAQDRLIRQSLSLLLRRCDKQTDTISTLKKAKANLITQVKSLASERRGSTCPPKT